MQEEIRTNVEKIINRSYLNLTSFDSFSWIRCYNIILNICYNNTPIRYRASLSQSGRGNQFKRIFGSSKIYFEGGFADVYLGSYLLLFKVISIKIWRKYEEKIRTNLEKIINRSYLNLTSFDNFSWIWSYNIILNICYNNNPIRCRASLSQPGRSNHAVKRIWGLQKRVLKVVLLMLIWGLIYCYS